MTAPAGYRRLPDGVRCRCINLYRDADGSHWCCRSTMDGAGKVGAAIVKWRMRFGWTQREMANALDISPQFLHDIEHGRRSLADDRLKTIALEPLRVALIDARVGEMQDRIDWLKAHRIDAGAQPHAQ